MLLPTVTGQTAPPMAVAMGKAGTLYLMAQNRLGGLNQNDSGVLQSQSGGSGGLWGGPAYFNGPNGPMVFTQTGGDFLRGWAVNTGSTPSLTNTIVGTTSHGGYGGSLPIVSSNGSASGTGLVWLIDRYHTPFTLQAYDADSLGAPIVTFPIGTWSNTKENNPFLTPMEANGRVYAPGYLAVQVYGLLP